MATDDSYSRKRSRDGESVSDSDLPEVKRIRDDLLSFLDDSDLNPASQDLDSVMKSFEQELSASSSPVDVVDLTSDSDESQPELGYLLEASDDELDLPPSTSGTEARNDFSESGDCTVIGDNLWGFDEQFPGYDSLSLGNLSSEYSAFDDGLFEYSDACLDYAWQLGTLPYE